MRTFYTPALTFLLSLTVLPAMALETEASKLILAQEAVSLNGPRQALLNTDNALAKQPMFQQVFARLDFNRIDLQAAQMMTETFTTEEIRALITFMTSPAGRSIQMKMPGYQRLVGSMLQNEMKATFESLPIAQGNPTGGLGTSMAPVMPANTLPATGSAVGTPINR